MRARGTRLLALAVLTAGAPALVFPQSAPGRSDAAERDARIVHVLHRLAFGPRPGDLDEVRRMGLDRWIARQLDPGAIDESALEKRLAGLETFGLPTARLMAGYEVPPEVRREIRKKRAERGENASPGEARRLRRELMEEYGKQMDGSPRQVLEELQEARLLRAVYAERQLEEVLVDFWLNHFNVDASKGPERFLLAEYERDVIRRHAWGRFEDLLVATAKSPAMLFYLDNWLSVDPRAAEGRAVLRRRRAGDGQAPPGRRRGLNENYAREVIELHTLGVDGGYTQKDVTEVARCLTGWTIAGLRTQEPRFTFDARRHDGRDKVVLGRRIAAGGMDEGEQVLRLLAAHPATARFLSFKLARRFVADEPPAALVARAAETFRRTGGDIRAVVTTIVTSPEFFAADVRGAKVKTPFEFAASALRAGDARVSDGAALLRRLREMGMPVYQQQPPTGYKDTADAWVSTSGLLARLNLALDLAAGRVAGVSIDPARLAGGEGAKDASRAPAVRLLAQPLSTATRKTLDRESGATPAPAVVAGLILGSPEFQRR